MRMKLGSTTIKGDLADFRFTLYFRKNHRKYVLLAVADSFMFKKGVSPIEFHKSDGMMENLKKIQKKLFNNREIELFLKLFFFLGVTAFLCYNKLTIYCYLFVPTIYL